MINLEVKHAGVSFSLCINYGAKQGKIIVY